MSGKAGPGLSPPTGLFRRAEEVAGSLPPLLVAAERVAASVTGGVHGRRRPGQGDSFWEYRPIRHGEAASRIDWRRSARSGRSFVRETEWEAAQTVCLWHDASPRMAWRSAASLPTKRERACLVLLALAALLLRAGEHPRLLLRHGLSPAVSGVQALMRLSAHLDADHASTAEADPEAPPALRELPAHAGAVLFGDFLGPLADTAAMIEALASRPVSAVLVQVLDPAEAMLPFRGRVRFRGLGRGEGELLVPRAENLRDAYQARLADHQSRLARLCTEAGYGLVIHHTDHPAETALLRLHAALAA